MCVHSKKAAAGRLGRELSPELDLAGTLTLDIWPPELWEDKCLLFKPPCLPYSVVAAQAGDVRRVRIEVGSALGYESE